MCACEFLRNVATQLLVFNRVEYSWKNLGVQRPVKRSRDEKRCSGNDYYLREKAGGPGKAPGKKKQNVRVGPSLLFLIRLSLNAIH